VPVTDDRNSMPVLLPPAPLPPIRLGGPSERSGSSMPSEGAWYPVMGAVVALATDGPDPFDYSSRDRAELV
jgi:hypothetical protein